MDILNIQDCNLNVKKRKTFAMLKNGSAEIEEWKLIGNSIFDWEINFSRRLYSEHDLESSQHPLGTYIDTRILNERLVMVYGWSKIFFFPLSFFYDFHRYFHSRSFPFPRLFFLFCFGTRLRRDCIAADCITGLSTRVVCKLK